MGITIRSKRHQCDMGYIGFMHFRTVVASGLSKEIESHYSELFNSPYGPDRERFFKLYDAKTESFIENKKLSVDIANFLYQADCGGKINRGQAKQIYELIKDCDDEIIFGYTGKPDCAKMSDLKKIFSDGTMVKWN